MTLSKVHISLLYIVRFVELVKLMSNNITVLIFLTPKVRIMTTFTVVRSLWIPYHKRKLIRIIRYKPVVYSMSGEFVSYNMLTIYDFICFGENFFLDPVPFLLIHKVERLLFS